MTRQMGPFPWMALVSLLLSACSAGSAQTSPPAQDAPVPPEESIPEQTVTIWDGVFTSEQASRGERTAWTVCFACHSEAEWRSPLLLDAGAGERLGDLYSTISQSMPLDAPGALSASEYADVVAYILVLQGAPPGSRELPVDLREMDRIRVVPPPP
jgi:S-disulfanyl-L-cysteine oxidoreductase SoxD